MVVEKQMIKTTKDDLNCYLAFCSQTQIYLQFLSVLIELRALKMDSSQILSFTYYIAII